MSDRPTNCVRLACSECDRDDFDGITEDELEGLKRTWEDICEIQTYEESITVYADTADEPPGYSILDWYTHIGLCPDCMTEGTD